MLMGLLTLAFILFNSNAFQNWITLKVTDYLSLQFKTKITIDHIKYFPFTGFALDNVYFADHKNDTLFYVDELRFNFGSFRHDELVLSLNDVIIDGGYCKFSTYKDSTYSLDVLFNIFDPNDTIPDSNAKPFSLFFNRVALKNSRFRLIDSTEKFETTGFDGFNEDFFDIDIIGKNFWIIDDSLNFEIKRMSCKERSGVIVENIKGFASISSTSILFDSFEIKTPYSKVGHTFYMHYNGWEEMSNYNHNVRMNAVLESAKIGMQDIAFFAPFLAGNNQQFTVSGKAIGTTDNLKLKDLTIEYNNSLFKGGGIMLGLPNIDETFMDVKISRAVTNKVDLERLILSDLPESIDLLGNIEFKGCFTGFASDFVTYGNFSTAMGNGKTDINLKLGNVNSFIPLYSGNLSLVDFNLGQLFKQPLLGKTSLTATIDGQGFTLATLQSTIKSNIVYVEANKYKYSNINIGGILKNKMFEGAFKMDDENAEVSFDGTIDLNKTIPLYKFTANIEYADLKALHFDTSNIIISSKIDIDFAAKSIDENEGKITINNTLFIKNGIDYPITNIELVSKVNGDNKNINLKADMIQAEMSGIFNFATIFNTFKASLNSILPDYIQNPDTKLYNNNFRFSATIDDGTTLSELFFPDLNVTNASIKGELSNAKQVVYINIENLRYKNYQTQSFIFNQSIIDKKGNLILTIEKIGMKDTAILKELAFNASAENNTLKSQLVIKDTTGLFYSNIQALMRLNASTLNASFSQSSFTFKKKQFTISNDAHIVYQIPENIIDIQSFKLSDKNEIISVNGFVDLIKGYNLKIELQNLELSLVNLVLPIFTIGLQGSTTGAITATGDFTDNYVNTFLKVSNLALDKDTIGDFSITSNYDEKQKRILGYVKSISGKLKELELGGYIDVSQKPNPVNISIVFGESDLRSFQAFIKEEVTLYYGRISAKCKVTGTLDDLKINGNINIMQVLARIEYLKTVYGFNTKVNFVNNTINFPTFTITDNNGREAKVTGNIIHQNLSKFKLDFMLTEMNAFQLLNTTSYDNNLFYGKAFATGKISLKGPIDNLLLDGNIKSTKGTVFSIPLSDSETETNESLIHYVNKDTLVKSLGNRKSSQLVGFSMKMLVTVTPDAEILLVFDEAQDDKIMGSGKGTLEMELTKDGLFNIFGEVKIESGEYKFTAIDIFTRKFNLKKGGTITWTGDPLQANLNMQGVYRVRNTSVAPILTTATQADIAIAANQRIPVECLLNLNGNLLSPVISFDINFPDLTGNLGSDNVRTLENSLRRLRTEPEQMQQQVVSLMLFGTFSPVAGLAAPSPNQSVNAEFNNTLSDILSAQASNIIAKLIPGFNVTADFQTAAQTQSPRTIITASKKLFNERLEILGSFDALDVSNNNNIMGQYDITAGGDLKIRAYNRTALNLIYNKPATTQGLGLYYRLEFEAFNQILKQKNKEKQQLNLSN